MKSVGVHTGKVPQCDSSGKIVSVYRTSLWRCDRTGRTRQGGPAYVANKDATQAHTFRSQITASRPVELRCFGVSYLGHAARSLFAAFSYDITKKPYMQRSVTCTSLSVMIDVSHLMSIESRDSIPLYDMIVEYDVYP